MKTILILGVFALSVSVGFSAEGEKGDKAEKGKPDFEKLFSKKDADGDGKVTKEEFLKGAKDADKAEKAFGRLDKDADGSLSKEEFVNRAGGKKKEAQ